MELLDADAAFRGDLNGWMAGLVYATNNDGRYACGVDGVSNAEFESAFSTTMSTVRTRSAEIRRLIGK